MDISMLLDIDNLGANIAAALRSNPDIGNVSSYSSSSSRLARGRPYLYPTTNICPSRHSDAWGVPERPFIIKPWLGEVSSNGFDDLPEAIHTPTDALNLFYEPARRSPVLAGITKLEPLSELSLSEHSSPYQSGDEDWRTYLTDPSFSNAKDSLDFCDDESQLEFVHPLDEGETVDGCNDFLSEQLLFSAIPNFPTPSPAELDDSLSFAENASPLSTGCRPSLVIPSPDHSFTVDLREATPRHDETVCIPNGTYISLMELSPPAFEFGSARFSSLEAPSRPIGEPSRISSPRPSPQHRGRSPTVARRGLSGWGDSQYLQVPTPSVIGVRRKRRSPSNSPCPSLRRPVALSPLGSTQNNEETSSAHDSKRSKKSGGSISLGSVKLEDTELVYPDSDTDLELVKEEDSDSDDYRPSRSSSVGPCAASSFSRAPPEIFTVPLRQSTRRGKGKAKGSAALALAVVTQLGAGRSGSGSEFYDGDDYDPVALYREGRHGIRRKKNHPIPLPVPIPNLNKKSRGRKVPYVAGASTEDPGSPSSVVVESKNSGRSRRGTAKVPTPVALGGSRAYVCDVSGCGKCFVRGEHLKRHVRSIHTHDRPHPCPFVGCDKSFSRRDNLGQHVRIHLQS